MNAARPRIPVIIVAGFLGAGKTTLLRTLLQDPAFQRSALIVNEVGDVAYDRDTLRQDGLPEPALLTGGCVCCAMRQDLVYTLRDLISRSNRGLLPTIDQFLVETTGIADPANMLAQLGADPWARSNVGPVRVLTVADAQNDERTWRDHAEARNQLAFADAVYLSKRDLVDPENYAQTLERIRGRAPWALPVDEGQWAEAKAALVMPSNGVAERPESGCSLAEPVQVHAISTAVVEVASGISWAVLSKAVDQLAARHRTSLLRCKGVVRVTDVEVPIMVESVRDRFSAPQLFRGEGKTGYLSFIAAGDTAKVIAGELEILLTSTATEGSTIVTSTV